MRTGRGDVGREQVAEAALAAAEDLAGWLRANDLRGYDPYDALRSDLLTRLAHGARPRQLAIQALRRLPVNVRPLVGIKPYANAKGLALVALAASRLHRVTGGDSWRSLSEDAAERAASLALISDGEAAWGYPFDVQLRWGSYPAGSPNVIATVFTARSLLRVADALHRPGLADLAIRTGPFLDRLALSIDGERFYAYVEGNSTAIHNANLLAATLRAELAQRRSTPIPAHVLEAVRFSLRRQLSDGSWPYGEGPGLAWVDGFHTAYVLCALADLDGMGGMEHRAAVSRGAAFYVDTMFDSDGAPRYYSGSRYPIDSHNAASAIAALLRLAEYEPRAEQLARRVVGFALDRLQTRRGWFLYQRGRLHAKRVPYMRWSDAHMLVALAEVVCRGREPTMDRPPPLESLG